MGRARVPVELVRGVPVVAAPEEIDLTNADDLRAALLEAGSNGHKNFVVDLTRTRFCDSSGVRTLARAHRRALDEDRGMLLAVRHAAVLRVLEITGIGRTIPTFASIEDALAQATGLDVH
jgi:anti-sigma B factor antagonist